MICFNLNHFLYFIYLHYITHQLNMEVFYAFFR
nr:MAG TPA: hypothetical protein [Caudoviricetes sp.]